MSFGIYSSSSISASIARKIPSFSIQISSSSIYEKIKKSCKTVSIMPVDSLGSGCFISLKPSDLEYGLFLTAAHCVYSLTDPINYIYITNPITNEWTRFDISYGDNVFYDGIGDIAIVKTNINLKNRPDCYLKLSNEKQKIGDKCYVCGDPLGIDTSSFVDGIIRDNHFFDVSGSYPSDSIYVSCPTFSGNSGSPILNSKGDIIGLLVYGQNDIETLSGGPNLETLKKSLEILTTFQLNKVKKYLGLRWILPSPSYLQDLYGVSQFDNKGAQIITITPGSPFESIINTGDVLLSTTYNNKTINFGSSTDQRTPGILIYEYNLSSVYITYLNSSTNTVNNATIILNKNYNDVPDDYDYYLIGAI
jgi:S1-C subfamily serine protease